MLTFNKVDGFEWDKGNNEKNFLKHNVSKTECEEIFISKVVINKDFIHSSLEERFYAIGITFKNRFLFCAFVLRNKKIRIISARDANKKERTIYGQSIKKDTKI